MQRKKSPLPNLRAYLKYLAATDPNKHKEVFRHNMERSLAKMKRERFFVGRLFGTVARGVIVVWIDPYNYDCLVIDKKTRRAYYRNFYGLIC